MIPANPTLISYIHNRSNLNPYRRINHHTWGARRATAAADHFSLGSGRQLSAARPISARGGGEEIWDPDEQRRIDENKSWKRTDSPNDAWDIDKERDAAMYKRESLERLLTLTPREDKPDRPLVCSACRAPVSKRSLESLKDKAHVHRLSYGESFVAVGVFAAATVDVDPAGRGNDAKAGVWWPPRAAVKCCCQGCGEVLGWRVDDNVEETVGPFFALLSARLSTGPIE
uniref:CULT domain-containing protein n=1 Tax=Mantoniella antarctica TaxID=81844 RepID=A0A7S0T4Q5_9CHLO|mmetsp:Transcript_9841/g.24294  ORF Transcript_9841/g.24294 Transcript_9841/m.24294 type:complete len:229 (+) Transcript_9841:162-848(+)